MSDASLPTPSPPKKNPFGWMGYFAFLIVASIGVMIFMIYYNLALQMTPEQLHEARARWDEKGPKSYDMIYTKLLNDDERSIRFAVKVRMGRVQEVLMNGKPLEKGEEQTDDPRIFHSMDSLYRGIDAFRDLDAQPKAPKVYVTLKFDDKDGHLIEYIRRVMGTRKQRVQITVEKFTALP